MDLKDRKKQILKIIVNHYIVNGQPIGSKAVVDNLDQKLSTATIRNEMAALEEMGFLVQPHISAGRIPSDLAYRFYVDTLMDSDDLEQSEVETIKGLFNNNYNSVRGVIENAARVISDITNCVAIALLPKNANLRIQNVNLVKVSEDRALVVIVTNHGIIKDRVIKVPLGMSQQELDAISLHIAEKVSKISDIKALENVDYYSSLDAGHEIVNEFIDAVKTIKEDDDIIVEGAMNIFDFPEYDSVGKAKMLISSFQDKDMLIDVMSKSVDNINVLIGKESEVDAISNCSLITVSYDMGGDVGKFGIVGPKRMNYGKMLKILQTLSGSMRYLFDDN
ncbi:MAG: heat-inducible transcription repressor HrcA, partial [Clostridia bacterium]|nr:heat-inducible transcription repressor HrcA [Clostridia bacterium]